MGDLDKIVATIMDRAFAGGNAASILRYVPVVLFSGKKCSGKSYLADALSKELRARYGWTVTTLSFAGPLKLALAGGESGVVNLLMQLAVETREGKGLCGSDADLLALEQYQIREIAREIVSLDRRKALQRLGTEVGRWMCNKDVWARLAARSILDALPRGNVARGHAFIIDDWRFKNEYRVLKTWVNKADIIGVAVKASDRTRKRRGCSNVTDNHASEQAVEQCFEMADLEVDNDV